MQHRYFMLRIDRSGASDSDVQWASGDPVVPRAEPSTSHDDMALHGVAEHLETGHRQRFSSVAELIRILS